ncbi:MAG: sel1 repeat family protein, partial [Desulfovibrio sp.]|nr:sel1 repeat family protein [Desulfovibrio sp.]
CSAAFSYQALAWYEKAAEQGNAVAQANLGQLYSNGHGVRRDYAQARAWFEKAAEQGNAVAQGMLGVLYLNGRGVQQDNRIAKEWFKEGCDNGQENCCNAYREMVKAGMGY